MKIYGSRFYPTADFFEVNLMFNYIWPIGLVVLANVIYNICAKSTPKDANAFLSLTVTYAVAGLASFIMFLVQGGFHTKLSAEAAKLNWSAFALGLAIIGLEIGYIYVYRAGWKVNSASLVANIVLACILLIVGFLLYRETLSAKQIAGIIVCIGGLVLINS